MEQLSRIMVREDTMTSECLLPGDISAVDMVATMLDSGAIRSHILTKPPVCRFHIWTISDTDAGLSEVMGIR